MKTMMLYTGNIRPLPAKLKRPAAHKPVLVPPAANSTPQPAVDFLCNVCGHQNRGVLLGHVQNRECQSCANCKSSLRMRSVMYALAMELFGKPLILPEFPNDKTLSGLGMSDWDGYAAPLASKLAYTNTFYRMEPRLDITKIPESEVGKHRFLISSDVFEHIPVRALKASFRNSHSLLRDDGVFLFTVPFTKEGQTREHFPRMFDFRIIETNGKRFLYNRTIEGEEEIFGDLIFHGGDGMTLEMRMFCETELLDNLTAAGYSSVRVYADCVPEFGILWPMDWNVPIAARF